jgi:hypothetical protein
MPDWRVTNMLARTPCAVARPSTTGDLLDMRKRVETVALAQEDAPDSGGAKAAGGARRGAALLANGKDTAQ